MKQLSPDSIDLAAVDRQAKWHTACPILIMGSARTGSNLWRAILNQHPDVFIAQELQLWFPHRKGFLSWYHGLGNLHEEQNLETLLDRLYRTPPDASPSSFWARFWKRMHEWVPRDQLEAAFRKTDRSAKSFVQVVLQESACHAGKRHFGAKNPSHLGFLPRLKAWFPDARVLHLLRDPRAIYASQLKKKAHDLGVQVKTTNLFYRLVILGFVTIEWWWTYAIYLRYRKYPWYQTCRFEELMDCPEETLQAVCFFFHLEPRAEMMQVPVKASSYRDSQATSTGINTAAKDRWKEDVSWLDQIWLLIFCYPGMRALGYL